MTYVCVRFRGQTLPKKKTEMVMKYFLSAVTMLSVMASCGGGRSASEISHPGIGSRGIDLLQSVSPSLKDEFMQGETVTISYRKGADTLKLDSVVLYVDDVRIGTVDSVWNYATDDKQRVGRIPYRITGYKGTESTVRVGEFVILPVQKPVLYSYRVLNTYPHDRTAYTQGLYWHDGYLYEGTGQEGRSSLRKVDLPTGEVLQKKELDKEFFGEGIALLNGKIYQLTWQHNRGFIYDATTFKQVGEFGYSGEGWGIATDGKLLYMSDGSERIYVIDPDGFRRIRTLEIYTDQGKVNYLNEMEWIGGELWANVYMTDKIVRIDPVTGVVKGIIDMSGLLKSSDTDVNTDVLNGIAYDPSGKRIFVTGKNWNKLFEIELIRK